MKYSSFLGGILFILAFAFYLYGMAPSITAGDSGEFVTATHTLGIPHPPGFPTYTILSRSVTSLIPFGNPGYRSNLFSALIGAFAVWLLFWGGCTAGLSLSASAMGSVIFMLSPSLVFSSRVSEVFSLHAAFLAGILLSSVRGQWPLAFFLAALGFGNHQTIVLLLPGLVILCFGELRRDWRLVGQLVLAGMAGLSIYAFPYFRAPHQPLLNIGQADTLERLYRLITRADYGTLTLALGDAPARTMANAWRHLVQFGHGWIGQVTGAGILSGMLGLIYWYKRKPVYLISMVVSFLLFGMFFFWLGNLPFNAQSTGLLERFYIAPILMWALLAASGFQWLSEKSKPIMVLSAMVSLVLMLTAVQGRGSRSELVVYSYARNNFRSLPPSSVFVMDGGDDTFYSTAYMTQVEHRRSDVSFYDRGGVVFPGLYGADFRRLGPEKEPRRQKIEMALAHSARPLCYSTMNPNLLTGQTLNQKGLLYCVTGPSSGIGEALWDLYDLRDLSPWMKSSLDRFSDYRTRALVPYYAFQRGVEKNNRHDTVSALAFLRSAHASGPDVLWLAPNLIGTLHQWAYTAFQRKNYVLARQAYEFLMECSPNDAMALANHGAVLEREGDFAGALRDYEQAIQVDPSSAFAHFNYAAMLWHQGRWQEAAGHFQKVVALNPDFPRAKEFLQQAQAKAHAAR